MISNWKVVTFRGRYPELPPPLCELTLKWSNFFPIGWISGLEKYVMFQYQVCLFSRKDFDFVCFPRFLAKKHQMLAIFNLNGLYWWETDKLKNILTKIKRLDYENIFWSPMCCKSSKIDSCGFVQSWVSVRKKKKSSPGLGTIFPPSLVLPRYYRYGPETCGVFREQSEVFPEKKNFEVGQLLLVLGTPQLRPFFFKIWEKSPKSPDFRNEVAQLQKKFFFGRAC